MLPLVEKLKDVSKPWNTRVYWEEVPNGSLFPFIVVRSVRLQDVATGDDKGFGFYVADVVLELYCNRCDVGGLALQLIEYLQGMSEVLRVVSTEDVSEIGADIRCWRVVIRAIV